MRRSLAALFLLAAGIAAPLILSPSKGHAQMSGVRVVATCGTHSPWPALVSTLPLAGSAWLTVDTNYVLCTSATGGGGGGTVTQGPAGASPWLFDTTGSGNLDTEIKAGGGLINATAPTGAIQSGAVVGNGPHNLLTAPLYGSPGTLGAQVVDEDGNLWVEQPNWIAGKTLTTASVTPVFGTNTISGLTAAVYTSGSWVVFQVTGGSLPTGVSPNVPYVIGTSSSTVATITTVSGTPVTFSGAGSGTQIATQALVVPITDAMATQSLSAIFSGGGTISFLSSPDGLNWIARNWLSPASGTLSLTMSASNAGKFDIGGGGYFASYVSTATGGQTVVLNLIQSAASSVTALTSPLPNGGNTIGAVSSTLGTTNGWTGKMLNGLTTSNAIKTGAGQLGMLQCYNPNATVTYVQVWANTTAATTEVMAVAIAPTATGGWALSNPGVNFATGLTIQASTTPTTLSAPSTAPDCNVAYN